MTDKRTDSRDRPEAKGDLTEALYHLTRELMRLVEALHNDNHRAILHRLDQLERTGFARIEQLQETIMASQNEISAELRTVKDQLTKVAGEISGVQAGVDELKAKVAELQAIIDAGGTGTEVTQELIDAVAAVKAQAQVVDDLIPDAPTPPPV